MIAADAYDMTFSYDQMVSLAGFTMWNATNGAQVAISSLAGPLALVLIYSDPAGLVLPADKGPLRFVIADAASENAVMTGSDSVQQVNRLNVINP